MDLRPHQQEAARFLASEIEKGGDFSFSAPTGVGMTIISTEAVKGLRAVYVSNISALREQTKRISEGAIEVRRPSEDLSDFDVCLWAGGVKPRGSFKALVHLS